MTIQFTDDEIETIKEIIGDWGSDCPYTEYEKVQNLKYKLGFEIPPTKEELEAQEKRRKEFAESETGKLLIKLLKVTSDNLLKQQIKEYEEFKELFGGSQWNKNTTLRIRLPKDYIVKENNKK